MLDHEEARYMAAECLDLDPQGLTSGDVDQFVTMVEAYRIYKQRNDLRMNLWMEDNCGELAQHCLSKSKRLAITSQPGANKTADFTDDALDLVNYSVFFVRQSRSRDRAMAEAAQGRLEASDAG